MKRGQIRRMRMRKRVTSAANGSINGRKTVTPHKKQHIHLNFLLASSQNALICSVGFIVISLSVVAVSLICAIFHLVWLWSLRIHTTFCPFFLSSIHGVSIFSVFTHSLCQCCFCVSALCSLRMNGHSVVALWLRQIFRFVFCHSTIMTLWILLFALLSFQP